MINFIVQNRLLSTIWHLSVFGNIQHFSGLNP